MAFNFAHTVGTGYYYSSFHYLGYSPFSAAATAAAAHDGDVKPDIANCPWVSPRPLMSALSLSLAAVLLGEPPGALRGRAAVPRAGDEDRGAGNDERFNVDGSKVKFCGFGLGSGVVRLLIFGNLCPEFSCKFGQI